MPSPSDMDSRSEPDEVPTPEADIDDLVWAEPSLPPIKPLRLRTVEAGFAEFCKRLVPKYTESEAAVSTFQKIENCLQKSFDLAFIAPYGSRGHGTNVQGYSAIDSFAVVPSEQLYEDSGKSLEKIQGIISQDLPKTTITEGRPVVAVPFGEQRSERHHIVPAYCAGTKDGQDLFAIPGPLGRWVVACPAAHSIWINDLDSSLKNDLKSFIRMVKAWSYFNDDIVWRYYLEHCAADYLKRHDMSAYSSNLCGFFDYLERRELAPFEKTAGCNEPVYGTSIADKEAAKAVIRETHKMARMALDCEKKGDIADAFYWWRKIFDWRFAAF